ncbi:MAG: glutamine-hydrolyzing carbamoyl-phosphate synthase small subunit [Erysipelotrichaceae bacterium]|jgi:carbamoyl-phosphate synthase small subunit|nr:glutamine-hydrolyzing carbamoyl-phosphate synthase small subunit [Erysipelotrichaceae bacterium]
MKRYLVLEDGSSYEGEGFGYDMFHIGELVFNTSMTGYQEILTDNSYCGQIVMMTYPLIGNYGINHDDNESVEPAVFGFVIKDLCEVPSNFRCQEDLDEYLKRVKIPGIYGLDTRALTRKIRSLGTLKAVFCNTEEEIAGCAEKCRKADYLHDQAARVSTKNVYPIPGRGKKVVLMDFGVKLSILRELSKRGCDLIVVPYDTSAQEILSFHPDGILLSNGPGDPADLTGSIETIRQLIGKVPMFGICLGCQLIALASGAKTYKLKFGHRGANHPVRNLATGKIEITSQNHGFAVDIDSLNATRLEMSHQALNDGSCEGVRHLDAPCFAVQYHPEANAGPQDSRYLFDEFMELMEGGRKNA